ncbi:MAG: glycine--tRNA ligase [Candidatus Hodarchaeales archaeon]|jgi:glycyl-tRNA synthetase
MPTIETIEQLAKRRGFFYPSGEIYGGFAGFYEYGHLGTLMKRKIENIWRKSFLKQQNYFEIDTTNVMPEKVFEASGHLKSFVDPIVKCKKCGTTHRADHIMEEFLKERFEGMTPEKLTELIKKHNVKCSKCKGELQKVGVLNMMFPLEIGSEKDLKGYLRPETAQGVYVNFLRQFELLRKKLPIGLAIVGRAYRNEISPRQLVTRVREFSQAELQIFFNPDNLDNHENFNEVKNYKLIICPVKGKIKEVKCSDMKLPKFYVYHMAKVQQFFLDVLKIPKDKFRLKELSDEEKAFYNKLHWDMEFNLESLGGWKEIGGVHYRTDHDLSGHEKTSKQSQKVFFDNKKFIPHVLELSFGVDRMVYGMLDLFYTKKKDKVTLKLPLPVSPITIGVFPLVNKDGLDKKAIEVYEKLKDWFDVFYDDSGSIGRRYARADEIGIPICLTVDYDTKKDSTVTLRDRDTTKQERIKIDKLVDTICKKF